MRSAVLLVALAACVPKVNPKSAAFDEDLPKTQTTATEPAAPVAASCMS